MRNTMRRSGGVFACGSATAFCIATAQATASTTEANSTIAPSPISLTIRPLCSASSGSIAALAQVLDRRQRAGLVVLDQARVADDVGGQDRRQPPLGPGRRHGRPLRGPAYSAAAAAQPICRSIDANA